MRRLLLLVSLSFLANCYAHYSAHAQGYGYPPGPPPPPPGYYPPGYYPPSPPPPGYYTPSPQPPPPPYAGRPGPYGGDPAYSTENCGTPDEPKPCPPMPRVPLQYYPANRQ